jgi:hypothetical protein
MANDVSDYNLLNYIKHFDSKRTTMSLTNPFTSPVMKHIKEEDNITMSFTQLKKIFQKLAKVIQDKTSILVQKCQYDITLNSTQSFDKNIKLTKRIIDKPVVKLIIHEYDVEILNTILKEELLYFIENQNILFFINVKARKNLSVNENTNANGILVFTNLKGENKIFINKNLFQFENTNEKGCCDQCNII